MATKIENPVNVYKTINGKITAIEGSMSPTAAKCQYCGKLVTATQIKYGDGRGIVYSVITPENPKPIILNRAFHHDCVAHAQGM
jgi:hypothetical protein